MPKFEAEYGLGTHVRIDDSDIIGKITEVSFKDDGTKTYTIYAVEWLYNGTNQSHYISGMRLSLDVSD